MTTTLERITPARRPTSPASRWAVPLIAASAVMMRLPGLGHAPRPDEAGFLVVGQHWHTAGSSLYGSYWVDRPPLLLSVFALAAHLGGIVPLRLIGCLAVAGVVVGVGHVARRVAGDRAAVWAAFTAAALCVDPLLGTSEVNGELLSAPFVVAGIAASLHAIEARRARAAIGAAMLAGAAMVAALLVKQNMADVGVFAAVAGLLALREGRLGRARAGELAGGLLTGAVLLLAVMSAWTVAHGTSLSGVYEAMYPFRVAAGRVIADSTGSHASTRLWLLVGGWFASGLAAIAIIAGAALLTGRLRGPVAWGLAVVVCFDSVSVLLGGNYWQHYLIELVVPVSVLAGILAARVGPAVRSVVAATAVVSVVGWAFVLPQASSSNDGTVVGSAIHAVAAPTDTIVTAYGNAEVTQASGLQSPYPYLWSLPAKTLDPTQHVMADVLSGPSAPTWFVVWHHVSSWGLRTERTAELLAQDYHPVARLDGHTVYLHDGVDRRPPALPARSTSTSTPLKDYLP